MTGVDNRANDFGTIVREPSEAKESCSRVVPRQRIEKHIHATRDAARTGEPLITRDNRFERLDLKVLFNIDGKKMCRRAG